MFPLPFFLSPEQLPGLCCKLTKEIFIKTVIKNNIVKILLRALRTTRGAQRAHKDLWLGQIKWNSANGGAKGRWRLRQSKATGRQGLKDASWLGCLLAAITTLSANNKLPLKRSQQGQVWWRWAGKTRFCYQDMHVPSPPLVNYTWKKSKTITAWYIWTTFGQEREREREMRKTRRFQYSFLQVYWAFFIKKKSKLFMSTFPFSMCTRTYKMRTEFADLGSEWQKAQGY